MKFVNFMGTFLEDKGCYWDFPATLGVMGLGLIVLHPAEGHLHFQCLLYLSVVIISLVPIHLIHEDIFSVFFPHRVTGRTTEKLYIH